MILFDSSVLSRALRRRRPGPDEQRLHRAVADLMAGEDELGIPGIVLQETLSGIKSPRQFAELEGYLLGAFTIVHPTTSDYVEAARLRNTCLAKGLNVSGVDCLIVTLALTGHHELVAADADFVAISRHTDSRLRTI